MFFRTEQSPHQIIGEEILMYEQAPNKCIQVSNRIRIGRRAVVAIATSVFSPWFPDASTLILRYNENL